jgi:RNA polymerase sigma factor (sigma-70 family)
MPRSPLPQTINHSARTVAGLRSPFLSTSLQGSESARNSLIESYLPKVALIARLLKQKLPQSVECEELAQVGALAMLQAAPRWDPEKGEFWPFVYLPVRGAMLDYLGSDRRETFHVELSQVRVSVGSRVGVGEEKLARGLDLARAIKKLTTQERRVFQAVREGHRPRRIAGMLRITPQRVGQLRDKAARRLRAELVA